MLDLRKAMSDGIGIEFRSADEVREMLQECQRLGLKWASGDMATEHFPQRGCPYIQLNYHGDLVTGDANNVPDWSCSELVEWHLVKVNISNSPIFEY